MPSLDLLGPLNEQRGDKFEGDPLEQTSVFRNGEGLPKIGDIKTSRIKSKNIGRESDSGCRSNKMKTMLPTKPKKFKKSNSTTKNKDKNIETLESSEQTENGYVQGILKTLLIRKKKEYTKNKKSKLETMINSIFDEEEIRKLNLEERGEGNDKSFSELESESEEQNEDEQNQKLSDLESKMNELIREVQEKELKIIEQKREEEEREKKQKSKKFKKSKKLKIGNFQFQLPDNEAGDLIQEVEDPQNSKLWDGIHQDKLPNISKNVKKTDFEKNGDQFEILPDEEVRNPLPPKIFFIIVIY